MTPFEKWTIFFTGFGAFTGAIYSIWQIRQSRTKIKVEHCLAVSPIDQSETVGIKVINDSDHAITLAEIGVLFSNTDLRMTTPIPISQNNKPLPQKIEPHSSFDCTFEPGLYQNDPNMVFASHVYAQLSNGKIYKKRIFLNPAKERAGIKL